MLRDKIKRFIEENKDLILNSQWEELYQKANRNIITSEITRVLLDAGINPLEELNYIPAQYLENDDKVKDFKVPNNILFIGESAFQGSSLESIELPKDLKSIGQKAFRLCHIEKVVFPDSLKDIEQNAFSLCTYLKEIETPKECIIKDYAFYKCRDLKKVVIGDGTPAIDQGTFEGCTNLEYLSLPQSIMHIYDWAFSDTKLKSIEYRGTKEDWNYVQVDYYADPGRHIMTVHCTDGDVDAYYKYR